MTSLLYVFAYVALPLFGWGFAKNLPTRLARLGFAFLVGALLLTIEAVIYSTIGIRWTAIGLALPLIALSLGVRWRGAPVSSPAPLKTAALPAPALLSILGLLHFAFAIATTRSVAADYLLFWGVKGMLFAEARAIDPELLRSPYFTHGMVEYPPLVPVVQSWGALVSGHMPWLTAAVMSAIWLAAAVPVLAALLTRAVGRNFGLIATAFWTVAMTNSLVFSMSGGNAEAMILGYISIAGAALLSDDPRWRWIVAICLAGAAISKAEGFVTVGGLLLGLAIQRPRAVVRVAAMAAAPAATLGLWFLYRWRHDLASTFSRRLGRPLFHPEHFDTALNAIGNALSAGSWWLPWLFSLGLLIVAVFRTPGRLARVIPHLTAVAGSFAFFFYVYLQNPNDPSQQIGWTLPRISQPALSLLILAAAYVSASQREKDQNANDDVRGDEPEQNAIRARPAAGAL